MICKIAVIASSWLPTHSCSAVMDDNSSIVKYIEIVPREDFRHCTDFTDVKQEAVSVNVGIC